MTDASNPTVTKKKTMSMAEVVARAKAKAAGVDVKMPKEEADAEYGAKFDRDFETGEVTMRRRSMSLPPVGKKWEPKELQQKLTSKVMVPTRPVPVNMKRAKQFGVKLKNLDIANCLQFVRRRGDAIPYMQLQQTVDWSKLTTEEDVQMKLAVINDLLDEADKYVACSGTQEGLVNRLSMLIRPKPNVGIDWKLFVPEVVKGMGVDTNALPDLTKTRMADVDWLDIPLRSAAGAPWPAGVTRDEETLVLAYETASYIMAAADAGMLKKYREENPDLFVLRMKNKYEMMEIADLSKKVRPYYVLPTHLLILFSTFVRAVERVMANYVKDEESHSAYKMVWSAGGAEKLMDWVFKPSVFDWLNFGDDQLLKFRVKGKTFLVAPDITAMDMCLGQNWSAGLLYFYLTVFKGKLSAGWLAIVRLYVEMLTAATVVVDGGVTFKKLAGWHSGISGITSSEMVVGNFFYASQRKNIEEALAKAKDVKEGEEKKVVEAILADLVKSGEAMGLFFKPTTLGVYEAEEYEELEDSLGKVFVTQWKFLGNRVGMRVTESGDQYFIPYADHRKLFASLCTPRTTKEGLARNQVLKARAFGLWMAGGYQNEDVRRTIVAVYDLHEKAGTRMDTRVETVNGYPVLSEWKFTMDPPLPEPLQVEALYNGGLSEEEFFMACGAVKKTSKEAEAPLVSGLVEKEPTRGVKGSWADATETDLDKVMADFGVGPAVVATAADFKNPLAKAPHPAPNVDLKTASHPIVAKEHAARHAATLAKPKVVRVERVKKGDKKGVAIVSGKEMGIGEFVKQQDAIAAEFAPGSAVAVVTESGMIIETQK